MPKTLADGQLAVAATPLYNGGANNASDLCATLMLANTSGSLTETVLVTFKRNGGTARRIPRIVLLPNEAAVVSGISMQNGDVLLAQTSDATTVDYVVSEASSPGPLRVEGYDSNGSLREVNGTSVTGAITGTSLAVSAGLTSSGPTGAGIGYATGAGGTVTQLTNRATGVTLSKLSGKIQTDVSSLAAAGAAAEFIVTNTTVAIGDVVVVSIRSGATTNQTVVYVSAVAAGSFNVVVQNNHATTAEVGAIVINFAVIKAVTA